MDSLGSGTMDCSVGSCTTPVPWQVGHMPSGVFGENESEYSPSGLSPEREYSRRILFDSAETVPTVERAPPPDVDCCSATVGGSPSISPTCGSTAEPMSRRAKGATDSR